MSDYGPTCCVGGCCGPGSYCCGHPDNPHEHDESDLPPDPKPYYVVEADEGQRDGGRYTIAEVDKSADEGEWGGTIYNLAAWKPREGYAQDRKDYA